MPCSSISFAFEIQQNPRFFALPAARLDLRSTAFDLDQGRTPVKPDLSVMNHFVFKCPRTGMNVQHWQADEVAPDEAQCSYETVVCNACSRLHFINRSTGKLLGEQQQ